MRHRIWFIILLCAVSLGCQRETIKLKDGDIVFQTSRSSQSQAIQLATKSKYSHMGVVFLRNEKPFVFEAVAAVKYTDFDSWVERGEGGFAVIKRLRNSETILTKKNLEKMRELTAGFEGKPYDIYFGWDDEKVYCSELVWKLYYQAAGVEVGKLQRLRDFDLSPPVVQSKLKERYGQSVPLNELVISPDAMFRSELLETVQTLN